ncbi:hypothetical protein niasHT_032515 [Heterodera trifolii]|uniref:Uncharacterized protein n=1 Tax=Heterodera trifolii TaxID=157864 RepID=A0ABD2IXT0_9BILA
MWTPDRGQFSWSPDPRTMETPIHDLRGRIWTDHKLELEPEMFFLKEENLLMIRDSTSAFLLRPLSRNALTIYGLQ